MGVSLKCHFFLDLQMEVLKLSSYETLNFESSKFFHFITKLLAHVKKNLKMYLIIQLDVIYTYVCGVLKSKDVLISLPTYFPCLAQSLILSLIVQPQ